MKNKDEGRSKWWERMREVVEMGIRKSRKRELKI
jgi:hypothetical protein